MLTVKGVAYDYQITYLIIILFHLADSPRAIEIMRSLEETIVKDLWGGRFHFVAVIIKKKKFMKIYSAIAFS